MKKFFALLAAIALLATLTACGGSPSSSSGSGTSSGSGSAGDSGSSDSGSDAAPIVLKLAHTNPADNPLSKDMERLAEEVKEASGGRLVIEIYPDSILGDDDEIVEQIYNGANMMNYVDPALLESYYYDMSILASPYLYNNVEEIALLAETDQVKSMVKGCEDAGIKILDGMAGYYGVREIMSTKPIRTPDDMKGVNFRVPSTAIWVAMANAMGSTPTPVSFSEAYTALSQGVVNAIENPIPSMYAASFQEVCKYMNMTDHMYAAQGLVMSTQVFNDLPADLQEILLAKVKDFTAYSTANVVAAEQEYITKMEEAGVTVIRDVDKEAFAEACSVIYDTYPGWSDGLVENVLAAMESIRK